MEGVIIMVGIGVVLSVILFLALREVVLWYFKINAAVSMLEEIRDLLSEAKSASNNSSVERPNNVATRAIPSNAGR